MMNYSLKRLAFYGSPLIVGVVLIHSHITKIGSLDLTVSGIFPAYTYVSYLFSEIFARALYFICPVITIGVGLGVYYLMGRFLPKNNESGYGRAMKAVRLLFYTFSRIYIIC